MDLILREPRTFLLPTYSMVTELPLQISVKYFTEKVTHKHARAHIWVFASIKSLYFTLATLNIKTPLTLGEIGYIGNLSLYMVG